LALALLIIVVVVVVADVMASLVEYLLGIIATVQQECGDNGVFEFFRKRQGKAIRMVLRTGSLAVGLS
jgi:hypothetical protein